MLLVIEKWVKSSIWISSTDDRNHCDRTRSESDWERFWPHVAELLGAGSPVTLGRVEPIDDVAVAANDCKVFSTLERRKDEGAANLMRRLDDALHHAAHGGAPINEDQRWPLCDGPSERSGQR
jgi:hypothetical protein